MLRNPCFFSLKAVQISAKKIFDNAFARCYSNSIESGFCVSYFVPAFGAGGAVKENQHIKATMASAWGKCPTAPLSLFLLLRGGKVMCAIIGFSGDSFTARDLLLLGGEK